VTGLYILSGWATTYRLMLAVDKVIEIIFRFTFWPTFYTIQLQSSYSVCAKNYDWE